MCRLFYHSDISLNLQPHLAIYSEVIKRTENWSKSTEMSKCEQ